MTRTHPGRGCIPVTGAGRLRCRSSVPTLVLTAAMALAACGSTAGPEAVAPAGPASAPPRLPVAAAFYPLEELAREVGGDRVEVTGLTPPGAEPHDRELDPRQADRLSRARVVLYLGRGFQPSVEAAVAALGDQPVRLDLLDTVDLRPVDDPLAGTEGEVAGEELAGRADPHVWLDPVRMATMAGAVADALTRADPDGATAYRAGADRYRAQLADLDARYRTRLATCRSRVVVTSHRAFGYLAARYQLRQIPIAGISPEVEPDPRSLVAVAAAARAEAVTTIFLESTAPPGLARTVAREVGADLSVLDPVESLSADQLAAGDSYLSVMETNLDHLATGLGCQP